MKRIVPIAAGTSAVSATQSTASQTGGMKKRQSASAGPASGRNTAEALRRSTYLRTTRRLSHRLAEQHRVVEYTIDGPDPAGAHECLGIAPVAAHPHDADLLIEVPHFAHTPFSSCLVGCSFPRGANRVVHA